MHKKILFALLMLVVFSAGVGATFLGQYILGAANNTQTLPEPFDGGNPAVLPSSDGTSGGGNASSGVQRGDAAAPAAPITSAASLGWGQLPEGKSLYVNEIPKYDKKLPPVSQTSLPRFKSIDELASMLKASNAYLFGGSSDKDTATNEGAAPAVDAAPRNSAAVPDSMDKSADVVGTNVQVAGIDEGDIIKTDGKYLYIAAQDTIFIVKADDAKNIAKVSSLKLSNNCYPSQMFINGDKLVVIGSHYVAYNTPMPLPEPARKDAAAADTAIAKDIAIYPPVYQKQYVSVLIYDVSDRAKPTLLREIAVEGYLNNSRMKDGKVYVVATKWIYQIVTEKDGKADLNQLLPTYRDTAVSENVQVVPPDKIAFFPDRIDSSYLTVATVDLESDKPAQLETMLGNAEQLYMSHDNLYVTRTAWQENTNASNIYKFAITADGVKYAGFGSVNGMVRNQFSMDEFEGNLRVATTEWTKDGSVNNLYVLDGGMKIIGRITGLAKGESIHSVRFMGKTGYVVTFRQIDPLFVIDLSNPSAPVVKGELKVPGFSDYLHPVDENTLIGVGMNTQDMYVKDEYGNEIVVGTRQAGVKLSLFDVSNPQTPVEIAHKVIGGAGAYSEATYNHKAFYYDPKRAVMAIPIYYDNETRSKEPLLAGNAFDGALAFSVSRSGLEIIGKMAPENMGGIYTEKRICSIGNTIFYIANGSVNAYDFATFAPIARLALQ